MIIKEVQIKIGLLLSAFLLFAFNSFAQKSEGQEKVYEIFEVDKVAVFKGGEKEMYKFISENLAFPPKALENNVSGRVTVVFVVEKDGKFSDVRIRGKRRLGHGCEEAALDAIKKMSGRWEAAEKNGKKVRMKFVLPIRFESGQ